MGERPPGEVIWEPTEATRGTSNISTFRRWVNDTHGCAHESYRDLWAWTVDDVGRGWAAMWDFAGLAPRASGPALEAAEMPGARWFPGTSVNFAEAVLTRPDVDGDAVAILHRVEGDDAFSTVTWQELRDRVAHVAAALQRRGVGPGDHVVGVLPNVPETMIACLGALALGAVWSSCAPDFAADAVVERFAQIDPTVLFTARGYRYNGRWYDRSAEVDKIRAGLDSLDFTVYIDDPAPADGLSWTDLVDDSAPPPPLEFHRTAFDDPVWVLFTSGTTGRPKGLVQGHGGAVLGAVQGLLLHLDLQRTDRLAQHTSTGWVVWNIVLSSLMFCDSVVIYDGSPTHPTDGRLLELAAEAKASMVGLSGAYLNLLARKESGLGELLGGHEIRALWFTGSSIGDDDYDWAVRTLPDDTWFTTITGGTDVGSTFFLAGSIDEPVRRGQFSCRGLGVSIDALDASGQPVVDAPGELVITKPLPAMPIHLVNDPSFERYRASYFADFPGVWRHGDLVVLHPHGGGTLLGRSDATLNRNGIRIGTAEIYSAVDMIAGVTDSLVVDLSTAETPRVVLFVAVEDGVDPESLEAEIRTTLRAHRSPRHVPDEIHVVPGVPRTLNGKRVEVPVKRILLGADPDDVVNRASLVDPTALEWFTARGPQLHSATIEKE